MQPPFPAPPEERDVAKLALSLVVGGLAVVICLVGCVAGLVGVVVWQVNETNKEAKVVVGRFLDAMVDDDTGRAEADVCDDARRANFAANLADRFPADLESFQVHNVGDNPDKLVVPATLTFANGSSRDVDFAVTQELAGAGSSQQVRYQVCGADW